MQFATLDFLLFFLPVFAVAWLSRPYPTARKLFLLGASYFFYAGWDAFLLGLIVGMSFVGWWVGEAIASAPRGPARKRWLWVGLSAHLVVLCWFKYYSFFRDNIEVLARRLGTTSGLPVLEILLPVGISYLTFQGMAYLIDLYREHTTKARNLLDYFLFLAYFPKVLIGPMARVNDILPQLEAPVPRGVPDLSIAVSKIASGLIKKVLIATWLNTQLTESAFNAPETFSSLELMLAAYAYTIEVYCDFSGYTDIAIGISRLLGVYLPDNFDHPYRAEHPSDFWRRWHITFSNWLRDYVFFPLGGSRAGYYRTYRNLMIVMLITGIWHGSAWKYVVWGGIHGIALIAYKMLQDWRKARGIDRNGLVFPLWYRFLAWFYTFHLVVLARIFFRSTDMEVAWTYWRGLLAGSVVGHGVPWIVIPVTVFGLSLHFVGPWLHKRFEQLHEATPPVLLPVLWFAIGAFILVLQPADVAPYIYFKF